MTSSQLSQKMLALRVRAEAAPTMYSSLGLSGFKKRFAGRVIVPCVV
jgi:hypothetical protein